MVFIEIPVILAPTKANTNPHIYIQTEFISIDNINLLGALE